MTLSDLNQEHLITLAREFSFQPESMLARLLYLMPAVSTAEAQEKLLRSEMRRLVDEVGISRASAIARRVIALRQAATRDDDDDDAAAR